jgi:acetyl esterase/lipase
MTHLRLASAVSALALVACEGDPSVRPAPDAGFADAPPVDGAPVSCATSGVRRALDLRYATAPGVAANAQSLDVYQPVRPAACGPTPIMVWVHGGGWQAGDKANQIAAKVPWATGLGFLFVSVNYRLSPPPPSRLADLAPGRVMYPTHNDDVSAAIGYVRARAAEYNADASRVVIMGHSAGAGIASQVGANARFAPAAGPLRCVVTLDTEAYEVAPSAMDTGSQGVLYQNAFGSDPAVWREASALTHVRAGLAPFFVVTRGAPGRVAMSRRFVSALDAAGVRAQLVVASGLDHEGVNDAIGTAADGVITPALESFLVGCR